ncbi:hypothetical protein [Amycolatopsis pigmentata]|uniref:Uncharacterized protein n=1 Tax=Amycolatopsis pigmentata TaxID=450801 RepID=A0ABW5G0K2_9PSEU
MHHNDITTVGELLTALQRYEPDLPLRCATQPGHPMVYALADVVAAPHHEGDASPVVWLGIGEQTGYLPAPAAEALGWAR